MDFPKILKRSRLNILLLAIILGGCQRIQEVKIQATFPAISTSTQSSRESEKPLSLLFIGNSYTQSYFSIPQIFSELSHSGGRVVEIEVSAPGGWRLAQHAESESTLDKIDAKNWDYVVLQENGHIASVENSCTEEMAPAVNFLNRRIATNGTQLILFMQWACRDGTSECGDRDFDEMQAELQFCYEDLAHKLDALIAPIGIAWRRALTQLPELDLWYWDGLHASEMGTYLAACVFYAILYQQCPEGLAFTAKLSIEEANFLQTIAADTVLQDPTSW